jgi:hypothetical protein
MMSESSASESGAARLLEMLQEVAYRKWRVEPLRYVPGFTGLSRKSAAEAISEGIRQQVDYADLIRSGEFAERARRATETGDPHQFHDLKAPTRFENPMIYLAISEASTRVYTMARERGWPLPTQPLVGTMPTGDIHAYTVPVPQEMRANESDADHLIIFDWQFFLFVHLFSKAIARAFPSVPSQKHKGFSELSLDEKKIRHNIEKNSLITEEFTDLLVAYATTGEPGRSATYTSAGEFKLRSLETGNRELAGTIRESMELFVLGHEYGHVVQRNRGDSLALARSLIRPGQDEEEVRSSSALRGPLGEIDADLYGLLLATGIMQSGLDFATAYMGIDAYFTGTDMMRRALSVLRRGRSDYTATPTHPSLTLRRELLRESLLVLPLNEKARADAIANGKTVEFVAELLWDRTYRALKDLHRRGTELAPWWQS